MAHNRFWGSVCEAGGLLTIIYPYFAAMPVAAVNGGIAKLSGKSFTEGFDNVMDPVGRKLENFMNAAKDFGNTNHEAINTGLLKAATSVAANVAENAAADAVHFHRKS